MRANPLSRHALVGVAVLGLVFLVLPLSGYVGFFFEQVSHGRTGTEIFQARYLKSLANSVVLCLATACVVGLIGTLQAVVLQKVRLPGRRFFLATYFLPFLIPPYIHAIAWIRLVDTNGPLHRMLYSGAGVVLVSGIAWIPLVSTVVMAGLRRVDAKLEETALCTASPWTVLRRISLPLVRPQILAGCLLVILFSLNSFDVPDILRVRVVSVEIFIQLAAMFDQTGAVLMSLPLVLFGLLLSFLIMKSMQGKRYISLSAGPGRILFSSRRAATCGVAFLLLIFLVSTVLPVVVLFLSIPGLEVFFQALAGSWHELLYSTLLALSCGLVAVWCALPAAYLLARRHPLHRLLDFCSLVPLALPAVLFSLGLVKAANFLDLSFLSSTSFFCLLGLVAHFLFLGIKILEAGIAQIDVHGEEAAWLATSSPAKTARTILLPRLRASLGAVFFLIFLCCFAELSATLLLVPPGRETIGVKVYNLIHYGADDMVAALCLFIIMVMFLLAIIFQLLYAGSEHGR